MGYQESLAETGRATFFPSCFPVFSRFGQDSGNHMEAKEIMIRNRKLFITAALWAAVFGRAWAQAPQFATLEIEWENYVAYTNDLADPSKLATAPNIVNANVRNFRSPDLAP
jgi:hypothetical protein